MFKNKKYLKNEHFFSKFLNYGVLLTVFILPILFSNKRIAAAVTSKQYFFIGIVNILVFFWVYLMFLDKRYIPNKKSLIFLIPSFLFILSAIISTFLGADISTSLYSTIERGGGTIFLAHTFVFCIMVLSLVQVKGVLWVKTFAKTLLASAVVTSIFTYFTNEAVNIGSTWLNQSVGGGTMGNSTHVGSFLVFAIFLGIWLIFKEERKVYKTFYILGMIIILFSPIIFNFKGFFIEGIEWHLIIKNPTILIGQARAALLGIILGFVIGVLVYITTISNKKFKIASLLLIVVLLSSIIYSGFQIMKSGSKINQIFISEIGENRILFWEEAISGIKEKPVFGWGPENYKIVHQKYFNPILAGPSHNSEIWVDKPHNAFIETAVTQGFVGLILLLFLIIFLFINIIFLIKKNKIDGLTGSFFVGIIFAYVFQSQFAFDSVVSVVLFWVFIGVITGFLNNEEEFISITKLSRVKKIILPIVVFILITVWFTQSYSPSKKMIQAKKVFDMSVEKRALMYEKLFSGNGSQQINTGLGMIFYTLSESYLSQRSLITSNQQFINDSSKELEALLNTGEKVFKFCKNDYRFLIAMAIFQETYIAINQVFTQDQIDKLNFYIKSALELSPQNPFGYLLYNKILLYQEDISGARNAIDYAILLNPTIKESHEQKINFEQVYGTKEQQKEALLKAQESIPGYGL